MFFSSNSSQMRSDFVVVVVFIFLTAFFFSAHPKDDKIRSLLSDFRLFRTYSNKQNIRFYIDEFSSHLVPVLAFRRKFVCVCVKAFLLGIMIMFMINLQKEHCLFGKHKQVQSVCKKFFSHLLS